MQNFLLRHCPTPKVAMAILQAQRLTPPEDTLRYCVAGYDVFCISFTSLPDTKGGDGNPPGFTANSPEDTLRYCVAGYDVLL